MSIPYQKVFSPRASPFMRWVLSPLLLLFAGIFFIPLTESMQESRLEGVIACSGLIIACLAGVLALWGVPLMGRIVSGIVALAFGAYLVHECFIDFDGDWGWGKPKAQTTPVNSIMAFLVFGLPCLIYTVLGRFTIRKEPEDDGEFSGEDWEDDDEIEEKSERSRE